MNQLTSKEWWKAASIRAVRSALVISIAYVPASLSAEVPYITIALAAALGLIVSFLTSLTGLPEVAGVNEPWWKAVIERVVKSIAQGAIVGVGAAVLITDVDWSQVGTMALTAGFGSLLLAVIASLPEDNGITGTTVTVNTGTVSNVEVVTNSIPVVEIEESAITTGKIGVGTIHAENIGLGKLNADNLSVRPEPMDKKDNSIE